MAKGQSKKGSDKKKPAKTPKEKKQAKREKKENSGVIDATLRHNAA